MIQQRSLLQSDSREVHVGHYHLFFTKASGSKLSFANFRIESTEKKRQKKTSLPVFQLPPGLSFHIGSPFASPVGVPDPKRSHNALEPSVPHLLARSSSANVHCSGRSSQISPRNSMAWHSWLAVGTLQICGVFHPFLTKYPHSLPPINSPGKFNGPLLYTINWHSNAKSLSHSRMYIYI